MISVLRERFKHVSVLVPYTRPYTVQTALKDVRQSRFGWMKKRVFVELEDAWPAARAVHAMPNGEVWVVSPENVIRIN